MPLSRPSGCVPRLTGACRSRQNWTEGVEGARDLENPWRYWSGKQLGTCNTIEVDADAPTSALSFQAELNECGEQSAHPASYRNIPPGGYVASFIPFVSDVLLPEERGPASSVIDFKKHIQGGFCAPARASTRTAVAALGSLQLAGH